MVTQFQARSRPALCGLTLGVMCFTVGTSKGGLLCKVPTLCLWG